jgi:hypothetical protein
MTTSTSTPTLVVATHGHCFDGLASATLFTRLYRELHAQTKQETIAYRACDYGPKDRGVPPAWLIGKDNVILDYRYSALSQLTWYFDHHRTAFSTPEELQGFEQIAQNQPKNFFYNAAYTSCTLLIADKAQEVYDLQFPELKELITWADQIDSANFSDPEQLVLQKDPALQLASVIEHHGDDAFVTRWVPRLLEQPLVEIATHPDIQELYAPIAELNRQTIERMKIASTVNGHVVVCDLLGGVTESINKFALYALFPQTAYSLIMLRFRQKVKVSLGYNPWSGIPRTHDISAICKRYGGGGHPVVGSFALLPHERDKAKEISIEILRELNT